jgi:hypothetical protein
MNNLPHDKQVEIVGMLCEGVGQRAVSRLTNTDRKTVGRLAFAVGRGCAELHDRMMVGLHVHRIECDELWAYVGHKRNPQAGPKRRPSPVMGDQYTYVALASATRAIIGYRTQAHNRDNGRFYSGLAPARHRRTGNQHGWFALLPASNP